MFVSVSQFARALKLMSLSIALRQTQNITQVLAQLHLRPLSVSVTCGHGFLALRWHVAIPPRPNGGSAAFVRTERCELYLQVLP
jgi:predicted amino acid-binding ACT domain protein